jgi:hypothetical protein
MLVLSVLSGLCVASCFLTFTETLIAAIVHLAVFTATIVWALMAGTSLFQLIPPNDDPGRTRRVVMDFAALAGIGIIGIAPLFVFSKGASATTNLVATSSLAAAYFLMTITTVRHVMLYRLLAGVCRTINRYRMARALLVLGWVKAIYEFLWLGSCAGALMLIAGKELDMPSSATEMAVGFALAALFGVAGFALVWIWMIVTHALLLRVAR